MAPAPGTINNPRGKNQFWRTPGDISADSARAWLTDAAYYAEQQRGHAANLQAMRESRIAALDGARRNLGLPVKRLAHLIGRNRTTISLLLVGKYAGRGADEMLDQIDTFLHSYAEVAP